MGAASRRKGVTGERDVASLWERHGFTVRGLEAAGDHLIVSQPRVFQPHRNPLTLHSEVKRCETARPWAWMAQAEAEAPPSVVPVVAFRRSRSKWYAMIGLDDLARLLGDS